MTFLLFAMLMYFLPSIIGHRKRDFTGIFILNLLFGWTVIGWLVALVWACASDVRRDDCRRSFLPELRPAVVSCAIHTLLPKLPSAVVSPTRSKSLSELRPPNTVIPVRATEGVR
jgi:hypothetical protein